MMGALFTRAQMPSPTFGCLNNGETQSLSADKDAWAILKLVLPHGREQPLDISRTKGDVVVQKEHGIIFKQ